MTWIAWIIYVAGMPMMTIIISRALRNKNEFRGVKLAISIIIIVALWPLVALAISALTIYEITNRRSDDDQ
jgi:hypothetical protein